MKRYNKTEYTEGGANNNRIKLKGNNTTMSYYIGNRASNSIGLTRDTTLDYIMSR